MKNKIMFAVACALSNGLAMAEDVLTAGKPMVGPWYQDVLSFFERVIAFVI